MLHCSSKGTDNIMRHFQFQALYFVIRNLNSLVIITEYTINSRLLSSLAIPLSALSADFPFKWIMMSDIHSYVKQIFFNVTYRCDVSLS